MLHPGLHLLGQPDRVTLRAATHLRDRWVGPPNHAVANTSQSQAVDHRNTVAADDHEKRGLNVSAGGEWSAVIVVSARSPSPGSAPTLYEHVPVREGSEEYLDSEKYQLRPRDYAGMLADGRSLEPWVTRLNAIRRAHPALQQLRTLHFHDVSNESIIAYSKTSEIDTVVTVLTLDSYHPQEVTLWLDLPALGYDWGDRLTVRDEVTGATWEWGQANFVRLEPLHAVAHILTVLR